MRNGVRRLYEPHFMSRQPDPVAEVGLFVIAPEMGTEEPAADFWENGSAEHKEEAADGEALGGSCCVLALPRR